MSNQTTHPDPGTAAPDAIVAVLRDAGVENPAREAAAIVAAAGDRGPAAAADLARRRASGVPLAQVTERATFRGLTLRVLPESFAPRAETGLVVDVALDALRGAGVAAPRVVDVCCGTGNLGLAVAVELPAARVWSSDLGAAAAEAARLNARELGLGDRVTVRHGDLFDPLRGLGLEGTIDLIVCNPPYISTSRLQGDRAHLLAHEPREAFDAGPYGLSIHQRVAQSAPEFLAPGGWLVFEFGNGQARQLSLVFGRSGAFEDVRTREHPSGIMGVAAGRKKR